MEDKILKRLIEYCEEYAIESLTKDFQDKIKNSIENILQKLSKANDKLKKIEEYIKNKQVIDLDYVEKIIEGND